MDYYITYTGDIDRGQVLDLVNCGCTGIRLIFKGTSVPLMLQKIQELGSVLSGTGVKIMVDLPGLKPRLGALQKPLPITTKDRLMLTLGPASSHSRLIPLTNLSTELFSHIRIKHRIWIGDGALELVVERIFHNELHCLCVGGKGALTSYRSIIFPDSNIHNLALSSYDEQFLTCCRGNPTIDEIAISFVDSVAIVRRARTLLKQSKQQIISKIETYLTPKNLHEIISASDTILLGRGDLSMARSYWQLFDYQNDVISLCQDAGIRLIIATGIFVSLTDSQRPTIPECLDIGYLLSRNVKDFLIADDVSVLQPQRALVTLKDAILYKSSNRTNPNVNTP